MTIDLRPFQRRFLAKAFGPGIDTAVLSLGRGNGKSALAAHVLTRCLTPGDPLFQPGKEYVLGSASIEQARHVFRPLREELEPTGDYRFLDSVQRIGAVHVETNTRLRVQSSNAKTSFGLVGCPLIVIDEPGSLEVLGGQLLFDSVQTAMGKPGSPLRAIYIGTLAPASSGWWHELVEAGTRGSTYVQGLVGDSAKWDTAAEIRRCNPLMWSFPESRHQLLAERDEARRDSRLKARFLSYRLNLPTRDDSEMLLGVDDFQLVIDRPVGLPAGRPIVGVDLGGGRSWSAAVAIWESGRCEAIAVAPGIPSLEGQEKRDRVPPGIYRQLAEAGVLDVSHGLRVQPPAQLWAAIVERWGEPVRVVCDRFRLSEWQDVIRGACFIEPRVTRWSEASADVRALRKFARDGPLSIPKASQLLIAASLAVCYVKNDESGSTRLVKRTRNNTARDDVAAALALAAGAYERAGGGVVVTQEPLSYAVV